MSSPQTDLYTLLTQSRTIAVVGHSDKPNRDSYRIGQYLRQAGYRVYPVNPTLTTIDGQPCYPTLAAVPEPIDIVDVFRRSVFLPEIVGAAIAVKAKAVWTQLGVVNFDAQAQARAAGLVVVSNRCILVEHQRLGVPAHV